LGRGGPLSLPELKQMESSNGPDEDHVVDARLVERFAVCRDAPAAHLVEPGSPAMELIVQMATRPGARRLMPVPARARQVDVNPWLTVIVVPGGRGVVLLVPDKRTAFGAPTEAILDGSPIGSIGPLLLGLAPDGIELQPVTVHVGSTILAPVVGNVYAVTDPSWTPPKFG
jgi:hypothetical protein